MEFRHYCYKILRCVCVCKIHPTHSLESMPGQAFGLWTAAFDVGNILLRYWTSVDSYYNYVISVNLASLYVSSIYFLTKWKKISKLKLEPHSTQVQNQVVNSTQGNTMWRKIATAYIVGQSETHVFVFSSEDHKISTWPSFYLCQKSLSE